LENLPDRRSLLRMGQALAGLYCASFRRAPKSIVLDPRLRGDKHRRYVRCRTWRPAIVLKQRSGRTTQLRLFNAHHDEYGFQPRSERLA
jgi:hypothetical protein